MPNNVKAGYVLLSLPNSGSTFVADMIAKHVPLKYYQMEYFNPARNAKRFQELRRGFGCELVSCYRWIGESPGDDVLDNIVSKTLAVDGFDFTKEVFSPLKVQWFASRFHAAILVSDDRYVFPPRRRSILSMYEHAYRAVFPGSVPDVLEFDARRCYEFLRGRMIEDALRLQVPILHYPEIVEADADTIAASLSGLGWPITDPLTAARAIVSARKSPEGRYR
jgi:hypothetical protein